MEWIGLSLIDLDLRGKGFFFINNEMLTDNLLMGVTVCVSAAKWQKICVLKDK